MAKLTRIIKLDQDGKPFVKINGLTLYPLVKTDLREGDEVIFQGKNGKFIEINRVPWGPIGTKVAESLFKPLEKITKEDQTLDRIKLAILRHQLELNTDLPPTEFLIGKEFIEDHNISSVYKVLVPYIAGNLEFAYNIHANTIRYRIIHKLEEYKWEYYG